MASNDKQDAGRFSPAEAGVGLSDEFVASVHERLPEAVRLALWVLREVTRCPDPAEAAEMLIWWLDRAINLAAQGQGRTLTPAVIEVMRGCVVDAVLGDRRACSLAREADQELSPLATAGTPAARADLGIIE